MTFKDQEILTNLYEALLLTEAKKKEPPCPCTVGKKCTNKNCKCKACCSQSLDEAKKAKKKGKPDYLDVDKDGDKKESMKKALKDKAMKESSNFKELFLSVINEETCCGTKIFPSRQYVCTFDGQKGKVLKGESVLKNKSKITSCKPAHQKED